VAYSDRIEDDAVRRDFTMNAIYADAAGWIVDPLDGLDDLLARHVRFIENASERIAEDYLRILRFFRFHAWYGDTDKGPDPEGLAACAEAAAGMAQLSRERVGAEFRKLLQAPDPRQSLHCMDEAGVLQAALTGARHDTADKLIAIELKHHSTPDWVRRLVALDGSDPVEGLRMSRKDAVHMKHLHAGLESDMGLPELAYRFNSKVAEGVALLRSAAHGDPLPWDLQEQIETGLKARFPVAAADLMEKYSGKTLGDNLKYLENKWIQSDFELSKESLLDEL
jgi:poly(A) polymerase